MTEKQETSAFYGENFTSTFSDQDRFILTEQENKNLSSFEKFLEMTENKTRFTNHNTLTTHQISVSPKNSDKENKKFSTKHLNLNFMNQNQPQNQSSNFTKNKLYGSGLPDTSTLIPENLDLEKMIKHHQNISPQSVHYTSNILSSNKNKNGQIQSVTAGSQDNILQPFHSNVVLSSSTPRTSTTSSTGHSKVSRKSSLFGLESIWNKVSQTSQNSHNSQNSTEIGTSSTISTSTQPTPRSSTGSSNVYQKQPLKNSVSFDPAFLGNNIIGPGLGQSTTAEKTKSNSIFNSIFFNKNSSPRNSVNNTIIPEERVSCPVTSMNLDLLKMNQQNAQHLSISNHLSNFSNSQTSSSNQESSPSQDTSKISPKLIHGHRKLKFSYSSGPRFQINSPAPETSSKTNLVVKQPLCATNSIHTASNNHAPGILKNRINHSFSVAHGQAPPGYINSNLQVNSHLNQKLVDSSTTAAGNVTTTTVDNKPKYIKKPLKQNFSYTYGESQRLTAQMNEKANLKILNSKNKGGRHSEDTWNNIIRKNTMMKHRKTVGYKVSISSDKLI